MPRSRSARSSQGSGSSTTGSTKPDLSTDGSASPTRGDERSLPCAGPESPSSTTCDQLELVAPSESTSPSEGSRARERARLDSAPGSIIPRPFSGGKWPAPFASCNPDGSWSKMWPTSLLSGTEPSGPRFSGRWPRSGTTRAGIAFQRRPSAPRISVTGSSPLLPTPIKARSSAWRLALLPTPLRREGTPDGSAGQRGAGSLDRGGGIMLSQALQLLPTKETVCPSSWASTSPPSDAGKRSTALRLSPSFVEWMLGAPAGWSDPACPLSATEFRCSSD